jgi:L-methionine (R)-S-oxide reductase
VATDEGVLARIAEVVKTSVPLARKAALISEAIRNRGRYRWVGLYRVGVSQIAVIGWSGPDAPAYPSFSIDQGLCGAAVAQRRPVIVGDVSKDPRYLTTFGSTRSELVVPILDAANTVVGLIDAESERLNAFGAPDAEFLTRCGDVARPLWSGL